MKKIKTYSEQPKPCPHCGGELSLVFCEKEGKMKISWVECECGYVLNFPEHIVLEEDAIFSLLDEAVPDWRDSKEASEIFGTKITEDDTLFLLSDKFTFNISFAISIAKKLKLSFGQMMHKGDYTVSVSVLTKWLAAIAKEKGVEVLTAFAAEDIIYDQANGMVTGVKLVDQGLDKEGEKQPNYMPGETIGAEIVVLAEGCDGLLTEKFIDKAG